MRWFFGLIKILFVVLVLAGIINLAYLFMPKTPNLEETRINKISEKLHSNAVTPNGLGVAIPRTPSPSPLADSSVKSPTPELKSNKATSDKKYFLTFEQILSIESISMSDKVVGLAILNKLHQNDIKAVFNMADGGITYSEYDEIKRIMESSLSKQDVEKFKEILDKYKKP